MLSAFRTIPHMNDNWKQPPATRLAQNNNKTLKISKHRIYNKYGAQLSFIPFVPLHVNDIWMQYCGVSVVICVSYCVFVFEIIFQFPVFSLFFCSFDCPNACCSMHTRAKWGFKGFNLKCSQTCDSFALSLSVSIKSLFISFSGANWGFIVSD